MNLKREFENIVENRQGDGRHAPSTVRGVIYTGLMYFDDGSVARCPGYLKDQRVVWVAIKDRWNAYKEGRWRPEAANEVARRLKKTLASSNPELLQQERDIRDPQVTVEWINPSEKVEGDLNVGQPIGPKKRPEVTTVWTELAFYELEVMIVELAPNEGVGLDRAAPGGVINPDLCEVELSMNGGKVESTNVRLVRPARIDPISQMRVPIGAGETVGQYRYRILNRIGPNPGPNPGSRINVGFNQLESMYTAGCNFYEPELALDGDVWIEGVRSSLTRGIYETWTDDLRMGPMLRVSRQNVQEAASRYLRHTAAGEQRYATERDHPASAEIASTAITPIKVYIDDWFGDPTLYIGLGNFLMQLASGLDDNGDSYSYEKVYYDKGATDYGKLYNAYEGAQIK